MKNNYKRIIVMACSGLMLMMIGMGTALAQREVTGQVTDDTDEGLPGVYVLLNGSANATVTDLDGNYTIEVNDNSDTLVFQMLGMETQEHIVGNQSIIDVTLVPSFSDMEEVVVVGYGVQKKVNLTGSVASVD